MIHCSPYHRSIFARKTLRRWRSFEHRARVAYRRQLREQCAKTAVWTWHRGSGPFWSWGKNDCTKNNDSFYLHFIHRWVTKWHSNEVGYLILHIHLGDYPKSLWFSLLAASSLLIHSFNIPYSDDMNVFTSTWSVSYVRGIVRQWYYFSSSVASVYINREVARTPCRTSELRFSPTRPAMPTRVLSTTIPLNNLTISPETAAALNVPLFGFVSTVRASYPCFVCLCDC